MEFTLMPYLSPPTGMALPVNHPLTPPLLPSASGPSDSKCGPDQGETRPPIDAKAARRSPARLELFNPPPLPVSIHLIRDGKIGFDDLRVAPVKTGTLKGRGAVATREAQERMIDHLINRDVGLCRGRRCVDITTVVRAYYGGSPGVAYALASAPQDEQQAAARFLNLSSNAPALDLQYEPIAVLNRGVQALSAVVRHFDQAVERITATVQASDDEPQAVTALGGKEAWAYAHGRLHARLREEQLGLDSTRELRTQFFETLSEMLDDEPKTVAELDALVEDAMGSMKPTTADSGEVVIETKAGTHAQPQEALNPLAHLFLTKGAAADLTFEEGTDTSSAPATPVKQHGDTDWLLLNHHTRPLLEALPADSKGH